jgi:hypothetical protein
MSNSPHRSFEKIEKADLARLYNLARECLDVMLARNETGKFYSSDRALMACLCQGAAQHFVHGDRGVNDFDVVFFFPTNPHRKFPPRWRGTRDFGPSRFGANPDEPKYSGRRIDVIGRDIPVVSGNSAEETVVAYIRECRTASAHEWATRPLIVLTPGNMLGRIVWGGSA